MWEMLGMIRTFVSILGIASRARTGFRSEESEALPEDLSGWKNGGV